jgi:hypothetical protein
LPKNISKSVTKNIQFKIIQQNEQNLPIIVQN